MKTKKGYTTIDCGTLILHIKDEPPIHIHKCHNFEKLKPWSVLWCKKNGLKPNEEYCPKCGKLFIEMKENKKSKFEKEYEKINKDYAKRLLAIDENMESYLDHHYCIGGIVHTFENHSFDTEMAIAKSIRSSELLDLNTRMLLDKKNARNTKKRKATS